MTSFLLNWVFGSFIDLPTVAVYFAEGTDSLIKYNNSIIDKLFENPTVIAFFAFVSLIGGMLYVGGIGFAFANFTIENKEDAGVQITDTIKNIFIGLAAVSSYTTLPVLFLQFTNYICDSVCSLSENNLLLDFISPELASGNGGGGSFGNEIAGMPVNGIFISIYAILMFVCVCKVFFNNIKRGGVLITLIFVGSFHMFSIPRGYTDAFWSWCKQVVGVCITAFVQNFLIALAFFVALSGNASDTTSLIISAGVALSASEVPRILQQFGLDTSMRANVSQAIFAASGITNIVRTFV